MTDRVDAYAAALFEVAKAEGSLATVEEELFRVARTLEANDELRTTLSDQAIPIERRQRIVEELLGPRSSPVTTALVSFVVGAGRSRDLPAFPGGAARTRYAIGKDGFRSRRMRPPPVAIAVRVESMVRELIFIL